MSRPKLNPEERIIVALDLPSLGQSLDLVNKLNVSVSTFKVGPVLFLRSGVRAVEDIRTENKNVFLDLKFHDIPSTVEKSMHNIMNYGISMFTMHTLGGYEMMKSVSDSVRTEAESMDMVKPLTLGVTVLTSHTDEALNEIGINRSIKDQVLRLASLAEKAGVDGLVCSGFECEMLRSEFGERFTLVVPGVRPEGDTHDQKRVVTPKDAVDMGADYLVIGRAITESENPLKAADDIINSIS